jgi:hypothetical protein
VKRIGGAQGVIIADPKVGDFGFVSCCDRDISTFKKTTAQSNPSSARRYSLSDGVYLGAMQNPANPNQFIQFLATGILIHDVNGNVIGLQSMDPYIFLKPPDSKKVYLGGDGTVGSFSPVVTQAGPSINVYARYA